MSNRASAARYARALLDVTINESDPIAAEKDLAAFVDLVQGNLDLQRTFANPVVSIWNAAGSKAPAKVTEGLDASTKLQE